MVGGLGDSLRPVTGPGHAARVRVPIGGLWLTPTSARSIDRSMLAADPDHERWLHLMDAEPDPIAGRLGLEGRLQSEVLAGETVEVHDHHGEWAFVTCPLQPSHKNPRGYPGYLRTAHLDLTDATPQDGTPHGDVDRASFLAAARRHLGQPWLWAGLSSDGLDCSGLVHLALRELGVLYPRDCADQRRRSAPVHPAEAVPGDLLFFARPGFEPDHVGIVTAPGRILHAPQTSAQVVDEELPPDRARTLAGAGRISALV